MTFVDARAKLERLASQIESDLRDEGLIMHEQLAVRFLAADPAELAEAIRVVLERAADRG